MSDFYSVLKQSIIDRGLRSVAEREEAYAQARKAMTRRLWSYDPPLAADEIDARIGLFDTAVERIENDVVEVFASMPPTAPRRSSNPVTAPLLFDGYEGGADDELAVDLYHAGRRTPFESDLFAGDTRDENESPEVDRPRDDRHSLDARSLAIEAALNSNDGSSEDLTVPEDEPRLDEPSVEEPEASDVEEERYPAQQAPVAASTAPARPQPATTRASPTAARVAPAQRSASRPKKAASSKSGVRLLVISVAGLAVALVAIVGWLLAPKFLGLGTTKPSVVLQTNVPGGVSDPDTAIRIATEPIGVAQSYSIFDGRDPTVFEAAPDNPVRFDGETARIATSVSSAGARAIIGPGLSTRLAGRTVRVTLEARSARENGASTFRFAYQSGIAISHWQVANLSSEFTQLGLVWRVPTLRTDPTGDAIIIEPGIPGSGTGVEIRSVVIDLVNE